MEDREEDFNFHSVFVEDAEEDTILYGFLWKTLKKRKNLSNKIFLFFSASSTKIQWFHRLHPRLPPKQIGFQCLG